MCIRDRTIMEVLRSMTQKRNITCIVNLHQLEVARQYATRIRGLSKGQIQFDGGAEELTDAKVEEMCIRDSSHAFFPPAFRHLK